MQKGDIVLKPADGVERPLTEPPAAKEQIENVLPASAQGPTGKIGADRHFAIGGEGEVIAVEAPGRRIARGRLLSSAAMGESHWIAGAAATHRQSPRARSCASMSAMGGADGPFTARR